MRDIAHRSKASGRVSWISTFFEVFSPLPTFLSPQMGSGSYKNSYRKLRVYTLRSQILVNGYKSDIDLLGNISVSSKTV